MAQTKQIDEPEEAQAKSGDAGKKRLPLPDGDAGPSLPLRAQVKIDP